MREVLVNFLHWLPKEAVTVIVASLPVFELRGAMPLGVMLGMSLKKVYLLSIIGNMIPVVPILFFLEPLSEKLRHIKFFAKFFDWFFERTRRKARIVEKFEALGLILFVAIPLPVTGAWTGCVAASLFKIRFRYALASIFAGVLIAGVIVGALIKLGKILI